MVYHPALPQPLDPEIYPPRLEMDPPGSPERLPLVDCEGRVVGSCLRGQVARGMLYPIVYAFICRGAEILIQRRSPRKDIAPGLYAESAGGHVIYGESYGQAITRETQEELGISCSDQDFESLGARLSEVNGWRNYVVVYRLEYSEARFGQISIDPAEVDSVGWWRWERVLLACTNTAREFSQMFAATFREFVHRVWPREYSAAFGLRGRISLSGGLADLAAEVERERIDGYPAKSRSPLVRCTLRVHVRGRESTINATEDQCSTIPDLYIVPYTKNLEFAILNSAEVPRDLPSAVVASGDHCIAHITAEVTLRRDGNEDEKSGDTGGTVDLRVITRSYTAPLASPPSPAQFELDLSEDGNAP